MSTTAIPLTVSKSQIKNALDIRSYSVFRRKVFTDQVITEHLQMTPEEFDRIKVFDMLTTQRICAYFRLTADSFTS